MPHFMSLSATGYRYFVVQTLLPQPWGKLARHRIFENTVNQHHGHVWGYLLDDISVYPTIAAKNVEEFDELIKSWHNLNLPDNPQEETLRKANLVHPVLPTVGQVAEEIRQDLPVFDEEQHLRNAWRKMAEEAADIQSTNEYARKVMPHAPATSSFAPNPAIMREKWLGVFKALQDKDQIAEALKLFAELIPATQNSLEVFLRRDSHEPARTQLPWVKAEKDAEKGIFKGWTLTAMALPADDPLAHALARNPGWQERDPSEANLATAMELANVMIYTYPPA